MSDISPVQLQCVAACKFVAGTTTYLKNRGFSGAPVKNAAGDFTFLLGQPVASAEQLAEACITSALPAAGASISVTFIDDTHVRVTTSNGTALADFNFNLKVSKLL